MRRYKKRTNKSDTNMAPSITEWISQIQTPHSNLLLQEDNNKYERLAIVNNFIDLPFTKPVDMTAYDLIDRTPKFQYLLQQNNNNYILRLTPKLPTLPKLRCKSGTIQDKIWWFERQNIDPDLYQVQFVPRCPHVQWASIFIVDDKRIWGEITRGHLKQLIQGRYKIRPTLFYFDSSGWFFSKKHHSKEELILKQAINKIHINNPGTKKQLLEKIKATFNADGYMKGYFEFTVWPKEGIKFTDYNRYQSMIFKNSNILDTIKNRPKELNGLCANSGQATGVARVMKDSPSIKFNLNDILVCKNTTLDYLPIMEKAGGIITEGGTMLGHATLIIRELNKPCIIQVRGATKRIKTGDIIKMNANKGAVEIVRG